MNYKKLTTLLLVGALFVQTVHGKTVEFIENPYQEQASPEIVERAERVATLVDYTKPYEIATPKKAGLQINPWNKLITALESNPQTKLPLITVNYEWLSTLPAEQQTFLFARCFTIFEMGLSPWYVMYGAYMYIAFVWMLILLFFFFLRKKSPLKAHKAWVSFVVALCVISAVDYALIKGTFEKVQKHLSSRYDVKIIEKTIAKTGDRDAAVQALLAIDAVVKEGAKNGEQIFVPHVELFERLANTVRDQQ